MAVIVVIAFGWLYVAVLMALAEATSPDGTLAGALGTLLLYGVGPLALVLYIVATPARRRARRTRSQASSSGDAPDRRGHAPRDAVAPEREEP